MTDKKSKLLAITLSLIITLLALPCFTAAAEENTVPYEVDELVMTIDIPSDVSVITSSVKKNDELFQDGTFDYISTMTKMRDDSALLYGKSVRNHYGIEIIATDNESGVKNLSKLSEKKQNKLLQKYSSQEDIVESSIYNNGKSTFFFSSRTLNNASGRFFYCDYYTVYNGNDITVRIISENDNINDNELAILKAAADSIRFPVKHKFTFSSLKGRGLFITFLVILAGFILVILYRRHDERVNAFALKYAAILMEKLEKERPDIKHKADPDDIKDSDDVEEKAIKKTTDEDDDSDEDEDLSSIDLDEAIAFFDENN